MVRSAPPHERHLGRHDGHEQHVGIERQAGHVGDGVADGLRVHARLVLHRAIGLHHTGPATMRSVMGVAALPMSIWPTAMSYMRPSRLLALVRPVIACLVEV